MALREVNVPKVTSMPRGDGFNLTIRRAFLQRVGFIHKHQATIRELMNRLVSAAKTPDKITTVLLLNVLLLILKDQRESEENELRAWGAIIAYIERENGMRK